MHYEIWLQRPEASLKDIALGKWLSGLEKEQKEDIFETIDVILDHIEDAAKGWLEKKNSVKKWAKSMNALEGAFEASKEELDATLLYDQYHAELIELNKRIKDPIKAHSDDVWEFYKHEIKRVNKNKNIQQKRIKNARLLYEIQQRKCVETGALWRPQRIDSMDGQYKRLSAKADLDDRFSKIIGDKRKDIMTISRNAYKKLKKEFQALTVILEDVTRTLHPTLLQELATGGLQYAYGDWRTPRHRLNY